MSCRFRLCWMCILFFVHFSKSFRVKDKCVCYLNVTKIDEKLLINRSNEVETNAYHFSALNICFRLGYLFWVYVFNLITHRDEERERIRQKVVIRGCFNSCLLFFLLLYYELNIWLFSDFQAHLSKCYFRMLHEISFVTREHRRNKKKYKEEVCIAINFQQTNY